MRKIEWIGNFKVASALAGFMFFCSMVYSTVIDIRNSDEE